MNFTEWKSEAMRLAWRCEETAISEFKSIASEEELSAARAALEAHLEALPMGEPVATLFHAVGDAMPSEAWIGGVFGEPEPDALVGQYIPLYRHPKESA